MNELVIFGVLVVVSIVMIVYALLPSKKQEEDEHVRRRMTGRRAGQPESSMARPNASTRRRRTCWRRSPRWR
jgi:hypothetical protein